jgi:hypothetical protein
MDIYDEPLESIKASTSRSSVYQAYPAVSLLIRSNQISIFSIGGMQWDFKRIGIRMKLK